MLELLDHGESAASLDDACSVGVLVPGENEEASGSLETALIPRRIHGHAFSVINQESAGRGLDA